MSFSDFLTTVGNPGGAKFVMKDGRMLAQRLDQTGAPVGPALVEVLFDFPIPPKQGDTMAQRQIFNYLVVDRGKIDEDPKVVLEGRLTAGNAVAAMLKLGQKLKDAGVSGKQLDQLQVDLRPLQVSQTAVQTPTG